MSAVSEAREAFLSLVDPVRPELHRYCARLTGSVVDGEDIVQDTLAKAFYALGMMQEAPPLRPWLFRIAHNTAMDFLKSHGRSRTEPVGDFDDRVDEVEPSDPLAVRLALSCFVTLPVSQRAAVILRDVLGHTNEEAAEIMSSTVMAVKAAVWRGRAQLRARVEEERELVPEQEVMLAHYAALFNDRDWDGLRDMLGEDCRLDLVSKAQRRGAGVGQYYGRYQREQVSVRLAWLEGRRVLAAYEGGAADPVYVILLDFVDGKVVGIRDYRYVRYIVTDAELTVEP